MKKYFKIILPILVCAVILGGGYALAKASSAAPSETNAFVSDYYIGATDQENPFFDKVLPEIEANIKENNKHSVTPYYDKLPVANNPENFQGLGSTTYANINGQTVTAEAFLRNYGDSLHDPNAGMGLLLYQCIQYKRAHPTEDVKITMAYYRTSASASVCVIPESKYYGYMRSLYGTNYDEQGFVRIAYMLTEAARMGIEVTMVNQLNSYGVNQYNPKTNSLKRREAIDYKTYFEKALKTECYDSYAKGKKVSDFFNYCVVEWEVDDKTTDMQHLKSVTASHYLATDGTEHRNAVFFTSSNMDDNDYKGRNGNGLAQSGVIITGHEDLYRVTYNYTRLMTEYDGLEEIFELQKLMNEQNVIQAEMLRSGKGSLIPKDEQIVYVGTENDPVFELYFTPFGGGMDVWDTENNAFCKYMDKLATSEDYVEYAFNVYGYSYETHIGTTMEKMVEQAFCGNPDPRNKISLRVTDFDASAVKKLKLGKEIGARSIAGGDMYHTKDMLISYQENGIRHRVTLLSSCNSYPLAFSLRTNSLLVINETDTSGGNYYSIYGDKFTNGMFSNDLLVSPADVSLEAGQSKKLDVFYNGSGTLKWTSSDPSVATVKNGTIKALKSGYTVISATDGKVAKSVKVSVVGCADCNNADSGFHASTEEQYILKNNVTLPLTLEAEFTLNKSDLTGSTTLIGLDDNFSRGWAFTVNANGNPQVMIRQKDGYATYATYPFTDVDVATGTKIHLTITIDPSNKRIRCFVNGDLAQTVDIATTKTFTGKYNPVIGGDYRSGNGTYFKGTLHSISAWSDIHYSAEVEKDYTQGINLSDSKLLFSYDFTKCDSCMMSDLSQKKNDLTVLKLWLDKDEVKPVTNYAYSFAVIGDTQTMCENDPEAMEAIYDWLIANKDSQKIKYVFGMGDITDDSTDKEWENANAYISKLNGLIPYSLCRGNHDDWDDFNRILHNGYYETTIKGMMVEGDIELTDPTQPGLIEGILPDGSTGLVTREGDVPEGGVVKGDLTNSYRTLEVSGTKYLILTLDFAPTSKALKWADSVIAAHPDHWVIATTHAYMYRDGTTLDGGDCYPPSYYAGYKDAQDGDDMWNKLFSKHKNVLLVLSGHDPWQHIAYRQDKGKNGNTVAQMLIDAQYTDRYIGSTGMVAMLYFSKDGKTMTVRYYSVEKDCYGSEISQFTVKLR